MAVVSVVSWQVKPGRREDFLASARESKAVIEPLGVNLRSIRLFFGVVAGPNSGIHRVSFEYDDLASWAATVEREAQDAGFAALVEKGSSPDSAATLSSRALLTEIGPGIAPGSAAGGSVRRVVTGRVKPGRMADYLARSADINQYVLRSGALSVRRFMALVAGENSGTVFSIVEYADMNAFAAAWQTRSADPEWPALVEAVAGADGPVVPRSHSLATEIPL